MSARPHTVRSWNSQSCVAMCRKAWVKRVNALVSRGGCDCWIRLPLDAFDIVHSKNAVDHSHDAPRVIQEMIKVARPGGIVMIYVNENVAKKENNWGFHRWNFEVMPRHYSVRT